MGEGESQDPPPPHTHTHTHTHTIPTLESLIYCTSCAAVHYMVLKLLWLSSVLTHGYNRDVTLQEDEEGHLCWIEHTRFHGTILIVVFFFFFSANSMKAPLKVECLYFLWFAFLLQIWHFKMSPWSVTISHTPLSWNGVMNYSGMSYRNTQPNAKNELFLYLMCISENRHTNPARNLDSTRQVSACLFF